jgi:hypothetical protein
MRPTDRLGTFRSMSDGVEVDATVAVTVLLPEMCVEDASCEVDVCEVEVAVVTVREAEVLGET